jgi:hypothetical protein
MGFFKPQTKELWKEALDFIKNGKLPAGTSKL